MSKKPLMLLLLNYDKTLRQIASSNFKISNATRTQYVNTTPSGMNISLK